MHDIYLVHQEYDVGPNGYLPVKLYHSGNDRYDMLRELRQQLVRRKRQLALTWGEIAAIQADMENAVEEQWAGQQ